MAKLTLKLIVQALVDRTVYDTHLSPVDPDANGNVNQDGMFDLGDLGAFSALLGGPASVSAVPAPLASSFFHSFQQLVI